MGIQIDRSVEARKTREPDIFLSHSSRDKEFVRKLAQDLAFLEVDTWLDEWELQTGDSLHDVITNALEQARFIAVILGDNYEDSRWARDELKQALARERRQDRGVVLPLLCGSVAVPAFLEDKVYLDFRQDYFAALTRLAGTIHGVSRQAIEEAVRWMRPRHISQCIKALRFCGVEPYVILNKEDWAEIEAAGGAVIGDRVRFSPEEVASNPYTSPRMRFLMRRLREEVWTSESYI